MSRRATILAASLLTAACVAAPVDHAEDPAPLVNAQPVAPVAGSVERGRRLAETLCAGCHAIDPGEVSPNPRAPTFATLAHAPGIGVADMTTHMHDTHNMPEAMTFEIAPEDADELAAYIVSLKTAD